MPTIRLAAIPALALAVMGPASHADPVERGRALLVQYRCGSCHTIPGVPASRGQVAAPLSAWSQRSYIAGRLPNKAEVLVRWIVEPQSLVPGTLMPAMGVSPEEARAMASYLYSLE